MNLHRAPAERLVCGHSLLYNKHVCIQHIPVLYKPAIVSVAVKEIIFVCLGIYKMYFMFYSSKNANVKYLVQAHKYMLRTTLLIPSFTSLFIFQSRKSQTPLESLTSALQSQEASVFISVSGTLPASLTSLSLETIPSPHGLTLTCA